MVVKTRKFCPRLLKASRNELKVGKLEIASLYINEKIPRNIVASRRFKHLIRKGAKGPSNLTVVFLETFPCLKVKGIHLFQVRLDIATGQTKRHGWSRFFTQAYQSTEEVSSNSLFGCTIRFICTLHW